MMKVELIYINAIILYQYSCLFQIDVSIKPFVMIVLFSFLKAFSDTNCNIFLGLLMVIDLPQERGLSYADIRWGDPTECRFPLFNFLKPLPLEWMYIVYLVALAGELRKRVPSPSNYHNFPTIK